MAALDLTTGRSSQAGAHGGMVLASLVKLDILETLLYQRQRSGQPLTDGQQDDVEAMIEHSDNAAADRLFRLIGRHPGMGSYNAVLDLHDTVLDTGGLWGLSTTSAADQLLLLQALVSPGSPLTAASRKYALDLLGDVEADQRWGVSAAGRPGQHPAEQERLARRGRRPGPVGGQQRRRGPDRRPPGADGRAQPAPAGLRHRGGPGGAGGQAAGRHALTARASRLPGVTC